jgi:adrenodoxin-NADP+ reductase
MGSFLWRQSINNVRAIRNCCDATLGQDPTKIFKYQYRYVSSTSILQWKVAIVGSGPSGCYAAKYLQASFKKKYDVNPAIDVIDRLPTPYGLVRYGVAPDHPEVKNVQNDFDQLFEPTSKNDNQQLQFYGNVHVGYDVSINELRNLYDFVVLAYGCESDRKLGIPGEGLKGVLSAREFVAWYNGKNFKIIIACFTNRDVCACSMTKTFFW